MKNITSFRRTICPICFNRLRLINEKDSIINYQSFSFIGGHKYKKIIKKVETSKEIYFISKSFSTKFDSDPPIKKVDSISFDTTHIPNFRIKVRQTFIQQKTIFNKKYMQKYYAHICSNDQCSYYAYVDEIIK